MFDKLPKNNKCVQHRSQESVHEKSRHFVDVENKQDKNRIVHASRRGSRAASHAAMCGEGHPSEDLASRAR